MVPRPKGYMDVETNNPSGLDSWVGFQIIVV